MMNNYISCEDCLYQEVCHEFDAFFGCENGKPLSQSNIENKNEFFIDLLLLEKYE